MKLEVERKNGKIKAPLKGRDCWLTEKPEELVRQEYICRLVNSYGYSLEQMAQEVSVVNSERGTGNARADIVIWKTPEDRHSDVSAAIVVECKAEHITIRQEDYYQGYNYAAWAGADFFVTTNQKETRIFRVIKGKLPKKLEEIVDIPSAKDLLDAKAVKRLLAQTKAFTRDEFSKLLFKCHNIIRNNDKLSPEAAFDEISKILFMKIRYERNPDDENIFSLKQFQRGEINYEKNIRPSLKRTPKDLPYMQFLFDRTKDEFKDDDLFDPNDQIRIRQNSFESIVEELQIYNLSTTSDDIKGIAFEQFLGRTFRGELGQFFTPRTIVDFMVEVLDPQEGEVMCDPCCGSGGFLIKAFEYVRAKIEDDIQLQKEKFKQQFYSEGYDKLSSEEQNEVDEKIAHIFAALNNELDTRYPQSRMMSLSQSCIYGTDANPRMARTAKMNMIMHGDGHGGVHHNDGLLNVNGIFENRFDVILTNPPFGARLDKTLKITEADKYTDAARIKRYTEKYGDAYTEALKQVNDHIGDALISLFDTGKIAALTEVLFIERCLNLLKPGGRMGIVLPEGVLNNSNLQKVRDYVESKAKILLITSIPSDVFMASGATVKPSLLFFKKFTDEETALWKKLEEETTAEATTPHQHTLAEIEEKLSRRGADAPSATEKKDLRQQLKTLQEEITKEARRRLKECFDYQIAIAEVMKAGITTTGAACENELNPLAEEFRQYRINKNLWTIFSHKLEYILVFDKVKRVKEELRKNGKLENVECFL